MSEWVQLLLEHAVALRKAGVLQIEMDGCKAILEPYHDELEALPEAIEDELFDNVRDPTDDPMTYLSKRVPGYRKRRKLSEQ
jgi:hypothetical protein